jgi:hypothetical protein
MCSTQAIMLFTVQETRRKPCFQADCPDAARMPQRKVQSACDQTAAGARHMRQAHLNRSALDLRVRQSHLVSFFTIQSNGASALLTMNGSNSCSAARCLKLENLM